MNTSIQINRESESYEALATALGHAVLKLLTIQANIMLACCALICLFAHLISGQHADVTVVAVLIWACHLAIMLCINIAKGGAEL